jgi:2-dehydro-3-deoxy-D-arabinonate dehydratase
MKLYRAADGIFVEDSGHFFRSETEDWDELLTKPSLLDWAAEVCRGREVEGFDHAGVLAPIASQEVWAAGVTYYRSRNARMEESKDAGGGSFYDRVYSAERPELFFKASGARVVGHGGRVRIRKDAAWSVPEPELTLVTNAAGRIVGYTIGNDMSSRDIEGENPLYLPQAKVYDGSCALGPCILLSDGALPKSTEIRIEIGRGAEAAFSGTTSLAELKREPEELVAYLFRESSFPQGVYLMTGTGIVPGDEFTLRQGDVVRISIGEIGTLENSVA